MGWDLRIRSSWNLGSNSNGVSKLENVLADEEKLLKAKEVWKSATKKSGSKLSDAASFFAICDSNESLKYTIRAADHCPLNPELLKNAGLRSFLAGQPQLAIQYFDRLERIPWNQKLYQRVERLITYVPQRPIFSLMEKMPILFGRNFDNYDITLSTVALEAAVQSKDLRHAEKWSQLLNDLMCSSHVDLLSTCLPHKVRLRRQYTFRLDLYHF